MSKDRLEAIVAGIIVLVLGISCILVGIVIRNKICLMILMIILGTVFIINAIQYFEKISKHRNH